MKNKQEIVGIITNIALVVLLFCFIVCGLNIIGIYNLPRPIEKLLGTYEGDDNSSYVAEGVYNSILFDESELPFSSVSLGYENAMKILTEISPVSNYVQKVDITHYYNQNTRIEELDIECDGGLYSVSIYNAGKLIRSVVQEKHDVTVTEFFDDDSRSSVIRRGEFDIFEECGFVLNVDEFVDAGYNLDVADYSQVINDNGTFIIISFNSEFNGIPQMLKYVISLDYGVVTEAYCYENDKLVYQMLTETLSDFVGS